MTLPERVKADYETMNLTTGPHPMKLLRENLPNIWRATDLVRAQHGSTIQIAGNVICRQRPGTAKGFVFISLEDETGVSNAIVDPDLFERFRLVITEEAFLLIEGQVQNSDGVVLIKARDIKPLVHESSSEVNRTISTKLGWRLTQTPYSAGLLLGRFFGLGRGFTGTSSSGAISYSDFGTPISQ